VREFAAEVAADGALVLYGACDAVVQAPYGPFAEALERLPDAVEPDELAAALGTGTAELSRLVPDLPVSGLGRTRQSRSTPTPSATASTRPSRTCWICWGAGSPWCS